MAEVRNFTIQQGLSWKRLVYLHEPRNHRIVRPQSAAGGIATNSSGGYQAITTTVAADGPVCLTLTADETADLPVGSLSYDVVATISDHTEKVVQGTVTVEAYSTITQGDEDVTAMILTLDQRADFYRTITWRNADNTVAQVYDAYMQAKNTQGTIVLDLRWFALVPNEVTIAALPGAQRGYLTSAYPTDTLTLHVSDLNTVPAGEHTFDLFVKDGDEHWSKMMKGTLVVNAAVSAPPVP